MQNLPFSYLDPLTKRHFNRLMSQHLNTTQRPFDLMAFLEVENVKVMKMA
jgi:hypothetical protein